MATEEKPEGAEGGGEAHKKSAPKLAIIVIIGAVFLALAAGGGFIVASKVGGKKKETKEGKSEEPVKEEKASKPEGGEGGGESGKEGKVGTFVSLDPIIVNLASEEGKRYLKVTLQVELTKAEAIAEMQNKMPQVKDVIITVLSSKTAEELLTIDGKFRLKEQLMTRVNSLLSQGAVKNVFFVEFVIQ